MSNFPDFFCLGTILQAIEKSSYNDIERLRVLKIIEEAWNTIKPNKNLYFKDSKTDIEGYFDGTKFMNENDKENYYPSGLFNNEKKIIKLLAKYLDTFLTKEINATLLRKYLYEEFIKKYPYLTIKQKQRTLSINDAPVTVLATCLVYAILYTSITTKPNKIGIISDIFINIKYVNKFNRLTKGRKIPTIITIIVVIFTYYFRKEIIEATQNFFSKTNITYEVMPSSWGPDRNLFTMDTPSKHITFNSITDNPNIGDERDFIGIRKLGTDDFWSNHVKVEDGEKYIIRMYVHNNAASNLQLEARGVRASFIIPNNSSQNVTINGLISSANATPNKIWDSASFYSDQDFKINYIQNSALLENNYFTNGVALSNDIVNSESGVLLGDNSLDGNILGCTQYAGYVSIEVEAKILSQDYSVLTEIKDLNGVPLSMM